MSHLENNQELPSWIRQRPFRELNEFNSAIDHLQVSISLFTAVMLAFSIYAINYLETMLATLVAAGTILFLFSVCINLFKSIKHIIGGLRHMEAQQNLLYCWLDAKEPR